MLIALTESHLKNEVKEAEIFITNFTPYRVDRKGRSHGGAIIYLRNNLASAAQPLISYSNGECEVIAVKIPTYNLVTINCYRPPQCSTESFVDVIEKITKTLEDQPTPMPEIILCGDFNFPGIQWPESKVSGGSQMDRTQARLLIEIAEKFFLTQQINKPTRKDNILDLLFTNNGDAVRSYTVETTIFSDHKLLTIDTAYVKTET